MNATVIKRCRYTIFLFICGYATVEMLKKIFRRGSQRKTKPAETSNSLEISSTLSGLSEERLLKKDNASISASMKVLAPSLCETCTAGRVSFEQLDQDAIAIETDVEYEKTTHKLNAAMQKYRRKEAKVKRRQKEIICMHHEMCELTRLMQRALVQSDVLDQAIDDAKMEMAALYTNIDVDLEEEIRKREPLCFKKFKNISTKEEAKKVLSTVRGRQKALKHLEFLTYKKLLQLSHGPNNISKEADDNCSSKDKKNREILLPSFRNRPRAPERPKPLPPPKPVLPSPNDRLNSHIHNANNLLNHLLHISITDPDNRPLTLQESNL